jgi:hypothetical protein
VAREKKWRRVKVVQREQVAQGERGTCYLLAASINLLEYQKRKSTPSSKRDAYRFYYADDKVIVRINKKKTFTEAIEKSYVKLKKGELTEEEVFSGGRAYEVQADITGRDYNHMSMVDPGEDTDVLLSFASNQISRHGKHVVLDLWQHDGPDPDAPEFTTRSHSYTVLGSADNNGLQVANPWGIDNFGPIRDGVNDGIVTFYPEYIDELRVRISWI